jgi:DNA-nicking Smr family endonuclease
MPARSHRRPAAPGATLTEDDRRALAEALAGAAPLPPANRAAHRPPPAPPLARQRLADEREVLRESLADADDALLLDGAVEDAWAAPGVARRTLLDLRRGRWAVEAEIDLHGCKRDEARVALDAFIARSLAADRRVVRIIHGRGRGSPGGVSILKLLSRQWLTRRPGVLAFCQARPADGGAGAVQVLLRGASRRRVV